MATGLEQDVQELFRCKDDGTVAVHRWITDVRCHAFKGMAKVCRGGGLDDEDTPQWTREVIGGIWDHVLGDVEARKIMWKSTELLQVFGGEHRRTRSHHLHLCL